MAKIICIEDESDIREDIAEALEIQGHTIIQAQNGVEGLQAIVKQRPDLAISDITMPVLDGLGLLSTIRDQHPEFADMPFVFLSALADRKDQIAGRELGADEYLTKPVDFELMHVVVKAKLRQVQRMHQNKDRQLLKMYGALTRMDILQEASLLQPMRNGASLNIISIAGDDMDLNAVHHAIKSAGHRLYPMKSGQKFLETVDSLSVDLLLIAYNTQDIPAPMLIKLLQSREDYPFQKILLMPQSFPEFPAMGKLPHFDAHLHAPLDVEALMQHINTISHARLYTEDLLQTA